MLKVLVHKSFLGYLKDLKIGRKIILLILKTNVGLICLLLSMGSGS